MKKLTLEQFIERSKSVHGEHYDYSKTVFEGTEKKVSITCPTHGQFEQRAADHMLGRGCALCNEKQTLTIEQFIERANKKHGSKFNYKNVAYKNLLSKIKINCPTHGSFTQTAKDHLQGYGCPACGNVKRINKTDFLKRATQVHGKKYDYSALTVKRMNSKGTIMCSIHGQFEQRLADHLNGVGCPECSLLNKGRYSLQYFHTLPAEKDINAYLYLVSVDNKFCKIGITKRTVSQRFGSKKVIPVKTMYTTLYQAFLKEQEILEKYKQSRFRAKGLRSRKFVGWTECFPISLLPELIVEFDND